MAKPAHRIRCTYAEYLALEATSNVKHEFLDGQIYGMAGGTPEHAALAAAVTGLLFAQLRTGRCRVHDSDLRVRMPSGLATYPDVSVVSGPRDRPPDDAQAVTNPTLIVEVTSPSTEDYDRGDKRAHFQTLASLRQYVLVSHRERAVEVWTRDAKGSWGATVAREGDVAQLDSVRAVLDVRELYEAAAEPTS